MKPSRECPQTFQGMLPNILGNVATNFKECPEIFRGMLPNILGISVLFKKMKKQSQSMIS